MLLLAPRRLVIQAGWSATSREAVCGKLCWMALLGDPWNAPSPPALLTLSAVSCSYHVGMCGDGANDCGVSIPPSPSPLQLLSWGPSQRLFFLGRL